MGKSTQCPAVRILTTRAIRTVFTNLIRAIANSVRYRTEQTLPDTREPRALRFLNRSTRVEESQFRTSSACGCLRRECGKTRSKMRPSMRGMPGVPRISVFRLRNRRRDPRNANVLAISSRHPDRARAVLRRPRHNIRRLSASPRPWVNVGYERPADQHDDGTMRSSGNALRRNPLSSGRQIRRGMPRRRLGFCRPRSRNNLAPS